MFAMGGGHPVRWPKNNRRAFVIRLIRLRTVWCLGFSCRPSFFEFLVVAGRVVAREERGILSDARGNEVLGYVAEYRTAFLRIGTQQRLAAPALQDSRKLPAKIDRIFQSIVEPEAAIGRVTVRSVAGNEHAPGLVGFRHGVLQVPEADMLELAGKIEPSGFA